MGPPIIPDEVLRTAFRRRAAGDKLTHIARDLGVGSNYLIKVLRGVLRPDLFLELGSTLSPRYFTPERYGEAKARQARKTARLQFEKETPRRRESKRAEKRAARRKNRLAKRAELPPFVPSSRAIPPEKRLIDEESMSSLILAWQETGDPLLFGQIITASLRFIRSSLDYHRFLMHEGFEVDELVSEVVLKLNRVLPGFDPHRGGGVFFFFNLTVRYHLLHRRAKLRNIQKRLVTLSPERLEEKGGFYESPDLPTEFRERLAGFTAQFTAPAELAVARYMIDYLIAEERIPSVGQVARATDLRLPFKQIRPLVTYVVACLRSLFAEDLPGAPQRFGVVVALSGVRLRVEVWVLAA